jgi:hypothetical protein
MFDARVHSFRLYKLFFREVRREHIIARNIMQHAEENNISYPLQHGFRKGRSLETQLIEFVDDISKNLQEVRQTDKLYS